MLRKTLFLVRLVLGALLALPATSQAQAPASHTTTDLQLMLRKLKTCGTVLYVAAHPDDENTRLIAYLARERHLDVYYLSLTRGDGGQNLIGPELSEGLGVIRTQELLAARRVDGGKQLFSRARDFGFSKNPDETFTIWPRKEVLNDVVQIIRQLKPDVIITRFSPEPAATHGHHTASAILALEGFKAAAAEGNGNQAPGQARRIFWNISSFFFQGRENEFKPENYLKLDIGAYNAFLGLNYQEVAANSRSQHKSQGFGTAGARGPAPEYFQLLGGDKPATDIMEGIDLSWKRLGLPAMEASIDSALRQFDAANPGASIMPLVRAARRLQSEINKLPAPQQALARRKLGQIEETIQALAGLRLEAANNQQVAQPGKPLALTIEATARTQVPVRLISLKGQGFDSTINQNLAYNQPMRFAMKGGKLQGPYSNPYWLRQAGQAGLFNTTGLPEYEANQPYNNPASLLASIEVGGYALQVPVPITWRQVDPVKGELYHPMEVLPAVDLKMDTDLLMISNAQPRKITLRIAALTAAEAGTVEITAPAAVQISPANASYPALKPGQQHELEFMVNTSGLTQPGQLKIAALSNGQRFSHSLQRIRYDHIPNQVLLNEATVKLVPVNLLTRGKRIGYIVGAGDDVPAGLRLMGYQVDVLTEADVAASKLKIYDAVVVGIRAYNTHEWLRLRKPELMDYMRQGGNVIVQYNTNNFLSGGSTLDSIAPYPIKIGRERTTVEGSPVSLLALAHPALNTPNKITEADFTGWVQERGLYYPSTWAANYTPILGMTDPGEKEQQGPLLIAPVGKGHYVYTGISFFRQLPAGVPGAYRLMANLIALGKKK